MNTWVKNAIVPVAFLLSGCSGTSPATVIAPTKSTEQSMKTEEVETRKSIEEAEKRLGKDHPMVKQMRKQAGLE
jgi:hypothetical protein